MESSSYSLNCGKYVAVIWRVHADIDLKQALDMFLENNRTKIECFWIAAEGPAMEMIVRCLGKPAEGLAVIKQRPLRVYSTVELTLYLQSITNTMLGQIGEYQKEIKWIDAIEMRIYRNYDELHPVASNEYDHVFP